LTKIERDRTMADIRSHEQSPHYNSPWNKTLIKILAPLRSF
jgi:hypothetical protein